MQVIPSAIPMDLELECGKCGHTFAAHVGMIGWRADTIITALHVSGPIFCANGLSKCGVTVNFYRSDATITKSPWVKAARRSCAPTTWG